MNGSGAKKRLQSSARGATPPIGIESGEQTIALMREITDTVMLAFSCGKDSIAAYLAIRDHFPKIVPYYMYLVPGLEFVEESLRYYEQIIGTKILRIPHPSLYRWLNCQVFTAPWQASVIEGAGLPDFEYFDIQEAMRQDFGLGPHSYVATGVRAADSPIRRMSMMRHGTISHKTKQFYPVWDWRIARVWDAIKASKIALPVDYAMFGRSFDGLDYRFLAPIKERFPDDYARICEWFPLAEAELKRRTIHD